NDGYFSPGGALDLFGEGFGSRVVFLGVRRVDDDARLRGDRESAGTRLDLLRFGYQLQVLSKRRGRRKQKNCGKKDPEQFSFHHSVCVMRATTTRNLPRVGRHGVG